MKRPELDEFEYAYVVAALWASTCDMMVNGRLKRDVEMDHRYGPEDMEHDTLVIMKTECGIFRRMARELLEKAEHLGEYAKCVNGYTAAQRAGHDFWLTRNGHGAGFWDRGLETPDGEDVGQKLTDLAHSFGEAHLWVSRGRVYIEQG